MRQRINDDNNDNLKVTCWAVARHPYSRVTNGYMAEKWSYELDVACSKQGLQTEDYKKYISILKKIRTKSVN